LSVTKQLIIWNDLHEQFHWESDQLIFI